MKKEKTAKERLLNSALLLGLVHIGLFVWGNEKATPLALLASYTVMMSILGVIAFLRSKKLPPPGATP